MNKSISSIAKGEIFDFLYNYIEVVPGWYFNTYSTIKRAHLYENSQFEDGSDYNGLEPIFYNITNYRRDNVARFLDIDTSDIKVEEQNPQSEIAAMILQSELRNYLKKENYTYKLNQMANDLATYGSLVLESTKNGDEIVDLRRLFYDPTVNSLQDSRFVMIKMYLTEEELIERGNKNGWDKAAIKRIIAKKKEASDSEQSYEGEGSPNSIRSATYFEVYKRWGYLPESLMKKGGNPQKQVKSFSIIAEPGMIEFDEKGEESNKGEVLYNAKWIKDEWPLDEAHLIKVRGRWLGIGIFELLFPMQQRFNEIMNQRRVAMEISSMHLFQSSGPTVFNNLLNDLQNGDVINTKQGGIEPIVNEERNLGAFQLEEQSYKENADALAFRNDVLSGDIPSSTPATNAIISQNNLTAVHLIKRQNFANLIRRFLNRNVIPKLIKGVTDETILRFVGSPQELFILDEKIEKQALKNELIDRYLNRQPVFQADEEEIRGQIRKELQSMGSKRFVKYFKGYYDNKSVDLDINIDSEQRDVSKVVGNTFSFISTFAQPGALEDPVIREFARSIGKDIGIDTARLESAFSQRDAQQAQAQAQPNQLPSPSQINQAANSVEVDAKTNE